MYYDIIRAKYLGDYKIEISFADGNSGIADLLPVIKKGGLFDKIKNIERFKNFRIHEDLKVLVWNDEIDVAPETLYKLAVEEKIKI